MSLLIIGCAHRSRQTRRCRRAPGRFAAPGRTLASLPQELERGGEGALRSGALRIGVVLFDEVCLKSRSDFGGRLERLIDGLFPRDASTIGETPRSRLRLLASPGIERSPQRRTRMPFLVRLWVPITAPTRPVGTDKRDGLQIADQAVLGDRQIARPRRRVSAIAHTSRRPTAPGRAPPSTPSSRASRARAAPRSAAGAPPRLGGCRRGAAVRAGRRSPPGTTAGRAARRRLKRP